MADIRVTVGRPPVVVRMGENTAEAMRQAALAAQARDEAQSAAAAALAAAGVGEYADTTAGLADTSVGETFWVDLGNGLGQVYRHDAGPTATALQKFIIDPTGDGTTQAIGAGNGRTQDDINNEVVYLSKFIPKSEQLNILMRTPTVDVTEYLDAARDEAKATGKTLKMLFGKYLVSTWIVNGAGYKIDTSAGVTFQQIEGHTSDDIPAMIIMDESDDVEIGDMNFIGNIATDEDEFNHAIVVRKSKRPKLGRMYGTDIRGDVVYCYGRTTSDRERLDDLQIAGVSGSNVYRNLLTVTGGTVDVGAITADGPVGYRHFDIEPNTGGAYQPVALRVGSVLGACVEIVSADENHQNDRFSCDSMELDWDLIAPTTPAYPGGMAENPNAYGIGYSYCRSGHIGLLKLRNFKSYVVNLGAKWNGLTIDDVEFANCNQTEETFNSIIVQQGTAHDGQLYIGTVNGEHTANTKWLVRANAGKLNLTIGGGVITGGLLAVNCNLVIENGLKLDAGGASGGAANILVGCPGATMHKLTLTDAASATLLYDSPDCELSGYTGTAGTLVASGSSARFRRSMISGTYFADRTFWATAPSAVASAANINLPHDRDVIVISGTTGITSITAGEANRNRVVTLVFQDALTVTDGSNLVLAGNFTTAAASTLQLACADGSNWVEVGRSTN